MNFKLSLIVLAFIGGTEAAWKSAGKVNTGGTFWDKKSEASFSSKAKKFGYINRIKACYDGWLDAKLEFDHGDICKPNTKIGETIVHGDKAGTYSSLTCNEAKV